MCGFEVEQPEQLLLSEGSTSVGTQTLPRVYAALEGSHPLGGVAMAIFRLSFGFLSWGICRRLCQ